MNYDILHRNIQIASIDDGVNDDYYLIYKEILKNYRKDGKVGFLPNLHSAIFINDVPFVSIYNYTIFINKEHILYREDKLYKYIIVCILQKYFKIYNPSSKDLYEKSIEIDITCNFEIYDKYLKHVI